MHIHDSLWTVIIANIRPLIIVHSSCEDKRYIETPRLPSLLILFEGQPVFRVVNEYFIHLVLRDAPGQHLRHNVLQDVRVAVASVLGQAVLGVDVVRDHNLVLVAFLHQERQAEHT